MGKYTGTEKRMNGKDRRVHFCIHEGDFGEIKSDLNNLSEKIIVHIDDQKERNKTFYSKMDKMASCLTQVSVAQETLPNKVVEILEAKKDKKIARYSTLLRNSVLVLGIIGTLIGAIFYISKVIHVIGIPAP